MSQSSSEDISVTEAAIGPGGTGSLEHAPQQVPNQAPHGVSVLGADGSQLISMYLESAEEEDKKMAENWKADAEGTLVFTGLFSAAVASFISVSIQDIRPNPQDTSNFYLANIYQTIADPNRSNISSFLPSSPPPFSPPNYAVWVNALWFMSLVISLTCALLATLLQQWARKYLRVTQPRYSSPLKRARIRTFFSEGVEGCLLPWAVEALPTLLHVSLFLFFAGLIVFLRSINLPIFKSVLSWVCVCMALYGCITFMPVLRRDSPYHTPLTPLAQAISVFVLMWFGQWVVVFALAYHFIRSLLRRETFHFHTSPVFELSGRIWEFSSRAITAAEEIALNLPSELDARAFMWIFDRLNEDDKLEDLFSSLAGFRSSKVVGDPLPGLTSGQRQKLSRGFIGLLDRTFSSDLVPELVKKRRAMICAKATHPAQIPKTFDILHKILSNYQYSCPLATDIVQVVKGWDSNMNDDATLDAQATISMILARVQPRDDPWFILASDALGIEESDLRDYAANGNSLSLAILIHATRQQFTNFKAIPDLSPWPHYRFTHVLKAASRFNVQDSSHELQHEFCALWNQIVLKVQKSHFDGRAMAWYILIPIRNAYIALHQDTDSAPTRFSPSTGDGDRILVDPDSYPVCKVPGHIHDHSPSESTPFVRAVALAPASMASPDAPSSPVPSPLRVDESLTAVPLLENVHCARQTTIQILRNSVTSLDTPTTSVIRDLVSSGITMPTPPTSTSALLSPTPPPAAISLQRNSDSLTPSDPPNISYPASTNLVLANIVPTDPLLSPHLPIARSNLSPPCLESHHSITVITVPSASPGPISAEDDDNLKFSSRKGKHSFESPSVDWAKHANTIAAELDFPPQLPLVTDPGVAITGRSLRESNSERTGDRPLHPLHCPYDMV